MATCLKVHVILMCVTLGVKVSRWWGAALCDELTWRRKLVAILDDRRLSDRNGFRSRDCLSSWDFVSENLFSQAAASLLFCHLIITRVKVLLTLLQSLLEESWMTSRSTETAHSLWKFSLEFLFLLLLNFLCVLLKVICAIFIVG